MDAVTIIYLVLMFIALYMFAFFGIILIRNKKTLFDYPKPNTKYKVSVIIPVYNEEESVAETVKHVCGLDYPKENLEVIVVNDGSIDRTGEILLKLTGKYKNLKIVNKKNSGKADSVNWGIRVANGELVAVADADSFPSRESLKKLTGYFDDPNIGAVTSYVSLRNGDKNWLTKIQALEYVIMAWSRKLLDYVDSVYVTNGPLSLYRKFYVLKVKGFDPKTVTEDIDITWNLLDHDYKTAMCLDAKVTTIAPDKFWSWWQQRIRWGTGGIQALAKYRKSFFKKGMFGIFVMPFVSLSILLSIVIFIFSGYLFLKAVAQKSLNLGYSIASSSFISSLSDLNMHPSVLLFFFLVMFVCSFSLSYYLLKASGHYKEMSVGKVFNMLFYMIVYLTLYPIVWFPSIYRFVKKDLTW